jgi:bifunctional oligoribonuclease and PAP phosphatase NrnA
VTRFGVEDWGGAVAALRDAGDVVVACHVNPDGDALGSMFAASLGLRKLGKRTQLSWGDENATVPFSYTFLPGAKDVVPPEKVETAGAFLALDCGAGDRLGVLEPVARASATLVNVDHHPGNDNFGTHNIVVTTASSTAELVHGLLEDLGVEIDRDIAICLYTGIVTDTGRFQYENAKPETLRLAADLLALGVPAPDIAQVVFDSSPFEYLKLVGRVLERAVLIEEERFVYSWITQEDLAETGVALEETEKLIDQVRGTRAADVAAIFKQQPDGAFRVSMRSKGPVSVGAIARAHGGGGHELAAGFTAPEVRDAVEAIRNGLRARETS